MNIFYLEWKSFGNEDMFEIMEGMGHRVIRIPFEQRRFTQEEMQRLLERQLETVSCDFLFSFNYFPIVSNCCKELGIKYVAWVYDSPHNSAYSYTILNECNYVFLFDYAMYDELHSAGIQTVYYLPLAVNSKRMSRINNTLEKKRRYTSDISFVGSLYSEPKHRLYDKFEGINPFARGYLDGLIKAQERIHGYYFLQELLTPDIVEEMQKAYPTDPNASTVLSPEAIYADYVLARQITSVERQRSLELLAEKHEVVLYTNDSQFNLGKVQNRGPVDYYNGMPYVFINSKINLNITLRSIKTGIPLRAMDIMGCGGFLLTNYQEELFEYFEADKDFVYYTDYEELEDKVAYYLSHDDERVRIAQNGCEKAREQHDMQSKLQYIIQIVTGVRNENSAI